MSAASWMVSLVAALWTAAGLLAQSTASNSIPDHPKVEPTAQINLTVGQPRLLALEEATSGVQVEDVTVLECKAFAGSRREFVVRGLCAGSTTLTCRPADALHDAICYLVVIRKEGDPIPLVVRPEQKPSSAEAAPARAMPPAPTSFAVPPAAAPAPTPAEAPPAPPTRPAAVIVPAEDIAVPSVRMPIPRVEATVQAPPIAKPDVSVKPVEADAPASEPIHLKPMPPIELQEPLELKLGQTRTIQMRDKPFRIEGGDEQIVSWAVLGDSHRRLLLKPEQIGSTFVQVTVGDPDRADTQRIVKYPIHVTTEAVGAPAIQRVSAVLASESDPYAPITTTGRKDTQAQKSEPPAKVGQPLLIHMTLAEVNRAAAQSMGLELAPTAGNDQRATTNAAPVCAFSDRGRVLAALQTLKGLNMACVLAQPTLAATDGQQSSFKVCGQLPIGVSSTQSVPGLDFVDCGVQVTYTATVLDRDRIRLLVRASASAAKPGAAPNRNKYAANAAGSGSCVVPGVDAHSCAITRELNDGETLVVSGLIQTSQPCSDSTTSLIGDLTGKLFRSHSAANEETELLLLISPQRAQPSQSPGR